MIKLICLDLDQTLISTGQIHFESLNKAISEVAPGFEITKEEHETTYNGLPTVRKLEILSAQKGLKESDWKMIYRKKQEYTEFFVRKLISPDDYKQQIHTLRKLKNSGYRLVCCSNAINSSVLTMLECSVGLQHFEAIYSNEHVRHPKPSPSIYLLAMANAGCSPLETLIIEDSPVGLQAARESCAHVMAVNGPEDIDADSIMEFGKLSYLKRL